MTEPAKATAPAPKAAPAAPRDVAVKGPDGDLYTVPASELSQLPEGADLATPEDLRHHELEQKYGGTGGALAAGALGAARGASFGLSDVVGAGLGYRQQLEGYQEANPTASTVGEVGGVVAPLLLSGGAGALAKGAQAAGALPRGVAALGGAVERGAAGLLGREATSLAGKVVQRALPSALGAAAEGAAYGIGHEISESAIKDHELTAEKLLAGAKTGALYAGVFGGALSGVGTLASEGLQKVAGAAAKRLEGSSLSEWLEKQSNEAAFRAFGSGRGGAKLSKKAEDFYDGGFVGLGEKWKKDAPGLVGKSTFGELEKDPALMGEAAANGLARSGKTIEGVVRPVDEAAALRGTLPKAVDVVGDIEAVANDIASNTRLAGQTGAVNKIRAFASDVRRQLGLIDETGNLAADAADKTITFKQLRDYRVAADEMWKGAKADPSLTGSLRFFGDVRNNLENRVIRGIEENGGEAAKKTYLAAKKDAQAWYMLQDAARNAAKEHAGNRVVSLTDTIAGAAGANWGGIVGGLTGGAPGALIGGAIGTLAKGAANKFIRTRGDFIAADALDKLARFTAVQRATEAVDGRITDGVRRFLQPVKSSARAANDIEAVKRRPSREELLAAAHGMAAMSTQPDAITDHLARSVGHTADILPSTTAHMGAKMAAAFSFVAGQAPKPRTNMTSLTPHLEVDRLSSGELLRFAHSLDGMKDPLSVLDDMEKGSLSHAKVDAVRATFPRLFDQIRDEVIGQVARRDKPLGRQQKAQLFTMFGVAVDDTWTPEFLAAVQAAKASPEAQPREEGPGGQTSGRPIKLDTDQFATTAQAAEGR